MSELAFFLRENKVKRENVFFPATLSLVDESGEAVLWEVRAVSTLEDEVVREECTVYDSGSGRFRLDVNKYMAKFAAMAVVEPNLYNVNLQNSYDVSTPEDLIREMIDSPSEYQAFVRFVQKFGQNDTSMSERIESAKN